MNRECKFLDNIWCIVNYRKEDESLSIEIVEIEFIL